ncbi:MAG: hypothetical protein ACW99A_23265 [Candidatus Kariarchaeaceae archaeon]|jgi:hypothetical protein
MRAHFTLQLNVNLILIINGIIAGILLVGSPQREIEECLISKCEYTQTLETISLWSTAAIIDGNFNIIFARVKKNKLNGL